MRPTEYSFDPDLSSARTIPAEWYRDPSTLARELDMVFARTWQLVGHTEQVRLPGDYFTCTVSEEPLVITRGEDGVVRALSNVCRHRAGPVARGAGHRKSLMCGYHGWTYSLDGRLIGTPEWDGVRCFEKGVEALPAVRVETWGPFLFVCLDATVPSLSVALPRLRKLVVPTVAMPSLDSVLRGSAKAGREGDAEVIGSAAGLRPASYGDEGSVTPPIPIGPTPTPRYPGELHTQRLEGEVVVQFRVDEKGRVDASSMQVQQSPHPLFTEAVRNVLPRFRFEPARSGAPGSKPQAAWVQFRTRFTAQR